MNSEFISTDQKMNGNDQFSYERRVLRLSFILHAHSIDLKKNIETNVRK